MAAVKKSVRLIEEAAKVCRSMLRKNAQGEMNWSGAINSALLEYSLMLEENKPELTANQWNALYCVYNGYEPSSDPRQEARLLSWHVSEGYQFDEQVRGFLGSEGNASEFINQIKDWSLSKQLSAIYHARKFWFDEPE